MTRIQASKARKVFADLIDRVRGSGERIILCRYGKDAAALVPAEDARYMEALEDRHWNAEADKALREDKGKSVPWEKVKADLRRPDRRKARKPATM